MARSLWVASAALALAGASLVWFLKGTPDSEVKPDHAIIPETVVETEMVVETIGDPQHDQDQESGDHELEELESASARVEDPLEQADSSGNGNQNRDENSPFWSSDTLRTAFEGEPVDPSWGPAAETEIVADLSNLMATQPLAVFIQEIECRTGTCRILLTHLSQPRNWGEFQSQSWYVTEMTRELAAGSSVVSGARITHRGGYPAELATSELFLYRSGDTDVAANFKTPFTPLDP